MSMRRSVLAFLIMSSWAWTPAFAQSEGGLMVIVNAENPVQSLSKDEISDMFLKKTSMWVDGSEVVPVNLEASSPLRASFSTAIHGRSVANVESYWQQQIFSGKSKPPLVVAGAAQMVEAVRASRGAIGYVPAGTPLSGVRSLSVMTPPERLEYRPPRYPEAARRARASGEVILEARIDELGNVVELSPIKELGFGLTREAMRAVQDWKYKPATLDGEPVPATISVSVVFSPN